MDLTLTPRNSWLGCYALAFFGFTSVSHVALVRLRSYTYGYYGCRVAVLVWGFAAFVRRSPVVVSDTHDMGYAWVYNNRQTASLVHDLY